MYRVYILLLLAIGFSAFAVDSSQSILQAKKISDTTFSISWSPIADAVKYKVFYDDSSLLDPANPRLLLDTDFITTTDFEVTRVVASTEYTVMVSGYTMEGKEIGKTIPLHVKTYSAIPPMSLSQDPLVSQDTILELGFSHPIDVTKTEITIHNPTTKKNIPIQTITSSSSDLRIIIVTLSEKMELSVPYEMTLQKIVSLSGLELSPENRIPLRIIYAGALPSLDSLDSVIEEDVSDPIDYDSPLSDEASAPALVPIDTLPQTGPAGLVMYMLFSLILFFVQKKLSRRA